MMPKKKYRIDLSSSGFAHYIEDKLLYVDKTMFIEHFLNNPNKVLLITRPRRMGKSLNMDMLAEFLDCKKNSRHLFKGLKIEKRKVFKEHLNKYPVIYLDFEKLMPSTYRRNLRDYLLRTIRKYLNKKQYTDFISDYIANENNTNENAMHFLTENLKEVYGKAPIILVDEYDHLLIKNIKNPDYEEMRNYIYRVFGSAFKGNPNISKVLFTGILRLSQHSIFSGLNNVKIYDIFEESEFDEDFGLTKKEVKALVEPKDFKIVQDWYNGIHVGNSYLFYINSVMNFLSKGKISNYWGQSDIINLLCDLLTQSKVLNIGEAAKKFGNSFIAEMDRYYALAVQAGYLTYERIENDKYILKIPNYELMNVWNSYILTELVRGDEHKKLDDIFSKIDNTVYFNKELSQLLSYKLSYHGFVLGLMVALGFDVRSNNAAGIGRYDLYVESKKWTVAIEFKVSKTARGIKQAVGEALEQIKERKYLAGASKKKAAYAVGIGVHKNEAFVVSEKKW